MAHNRPNEDQYFLPNWRKRVQMDTEPYSEAPYHILSSVDDLHLVNGIYFLNASDQIPKEVRYQIGGVATADEVILSVGSRHIRTYEKVLPGEAVRFDFYDPIIDSDFVLQYFFDVVVENGKQLHLASEATKGSPGGPLVSSEQKKA